MVPAIAGEPPMTGIVLPAANIEMSCTVRRPSAVFVSTSVAVEPVGMKTLPALTCCVTLARYCVPGASRRESIGLMIWTTTVPVD